LDFKSGPKNVLQLVSSNRHVSTSHWLGCKKEEKQEEKEDIKVKPIPPRSKNKKLFNFDLTREREPSMGEEANPLLRPPTWRTLGIVLSVLIGFGLLQRHLENLRRHSQEKKVKESTAQSTVGGFSLVDQDGVRRTSQEFRGQWLLVYFGFTHCPDVCPDELEKLAKVVENIDENPEVPNIQPVFITVDPERDTRQVIKKYIAEFSPKFIGLTGTRPEIDAACKNYRIYSSVGPKDEDNDYIVDHTIIIFLLNPDGEFVEYFGRSMNASQVTERIQRHFSRWERTSRGDWTFGDTLRDLFS